jgi:hypothetical protein
VAPFDPERILRSLCAHGVRFVLIGATAARLQGFPRLTADADVTPARDPENLQRLAAALRELNARVYTESVPEGLAFACDATQLQSANLWNLVTDAGRIDVVFHPSGTGGYEDLAASGVTFRVFGLDVRAASLEDILRSKRASDRPQDRQDALILEQMLRPR